MPETLVSVLDDVQDRLTDAANNRKSAMHVPVVATADADARMMVLRAYDQDTHTLRFHTDVRSPKAGMIEADPRVAVLFYDKDAGVQIRCRGRARIQRTGPLADAAWSSSDTYARRCYLGEPPGQPSDRPTSGLPAWVEGERPTEAQLEPARANFAVLLVEVQTIDWYSLSHEGHRRAVFDGGEGRWVTP